MGSYSTSYGEGEGHAHVLVAAGVRGIRGTAVSHHIRVAGGPNRGAPTQGHGFPPTPQGHSFPLAHQGHVFQPPTPQTLSLDKAGEPAFPCWDSPRGLPCNPVAEPRSTFSAFRREGASCAPASTSRSMHWLAVSRDALHNTQSSDVEEDDVASHLMRPLCDAWRVKRGWVRGWVRVAGQGGGGLSC
ncbi:hypothetical protein T484DRAFT_2229062 [Baffinella frigidus]|nr:hypothetical protein T484DRAFT_2229062 [Cryptophyta sp. CCMP2293]